MTPAIRTDRLTKYFGTKAVVRDVSLQIPRGSITALLGLNGAGKSTLLRMLMGVVEPTRGDCQVLGRRSSRSTPEDRRRIGYTVEGHFLYGWMSVREAASFQRRTFPRFDDSLFEGVVERFGIDPLQKVGTLSRGQRAGASIALTLATHPEVLILDDPSLGLDPVSRRALNQSLLDFAADGERTVLVSSHQLDDVERIADRVAILVHGRLLVDTTIDDFRGRVGGWLVDLPPATRSHLSVPRLIHAERRSGRTLLAVADPAEDTLSAVDAIAAEPAERCPLNLEDAVVAYLSRSRSDDTFYTPSR